VTLALPLRPDETGRLNKVIVKHARDAFGSPEAIAAEWRALNFTAPPDLARAVDEYDQFIDILATSGAELCFLPKTSGAGLDSIYTRDASVVSSRGMVAASMGKAQRAWEPAAQIAAMPQFGIPVAGEIRKPGRLEGGDVLWLDPRTVVVGRGYRTNDEGIRQFQSLLGDTIDSLVVVALPHWKGPGDVFHLMSIVSPVDRDLAVVYSPLLPVPFRELLLERGMKLVEVPDEEFDSMGANVLALGERRCVVVAGAPRTRALLERAGAEVRVYAGTEISLKGGGGPTCLTRPVERA